MPLLRHQGLQFATVLNNTLRTKHALVAMPRLILWASLLRITMRLGVGGMITQAVSQLMQVENFLAKLNLKTL